MTVLLLDGYNLLYRSFTSLPSAIVSREGRPIHGLYGMLAAILRLARDHEARAAAAAFDVVDVPTFRRRLYPLYQAQRGPLGGDEADEFQRQAVLAMEALPLLGVPVLTAPGYEADDVMASVAMSLANAGETACIVSTDRDLLQLVRPGIEVAPPGKNGVPIRDADGVVERMGVRPEGVPTLKALAGDPSDNVPGVSGIGPKTAATLVNQFGSLEAIYENLDAVAQRTRTALERQKDDAFLFRQIVTIVSDLPVGRAADDIPEFGFDLDARARELLERVGQ